MRSKTLLAATAMAAGLALSGASAHATEYLTNGSFETGDLTGWTFTGNTGFFDLQCGPGAEDGSCFIHDGAPSSDAIFSQTFADNPGDQLTVSGWINGKNPVPFPAFSHVLFVFNGDTIYDSGSSTPTSGGANNDYVNIVRNVTATGNDTFEVHVRNDPYYTELDNFSIATTGAPEPAAWALMLGGFFGAGALLRRRTAAATAA